MRIKCLILLVVFLGVSTGCSHPQASDVPSLPLRPDSFPDLESPGQSPGHVAASPRLAEGDQLCSALHDAAQSDPVMALVNGLSGVELTGAVSAHRVALGEALLSSTGDLAVALGILAGSLDDFEALTLDVRPDLIDQGELARWIVARANPRVVDPLAAAENACLVGSDD